MQNMQSIQPNLIDLNRSIVMKDYESADMKNTEAFIQGDVKATSQYIYPNQKLDAANITNKFYRTPVRVISIVKKTKVGMDGLMIELAKNLATHSDDQFAINRKNIFFITAMSNVSWEEDMKEKIPDCFKENVYHHGKLQRLKDKLRHIRNAIIINDEIDSGDKEGQKLHTLLKESGVLDMTFMEENNIRFVFVSATIINELRELYKWKDKHTSHFMTVPDTYIGHEEFLERGILKEYYDVKNSETAYRWIQEDIIDNYGSDFRVHFIRTDKKRHHFVFDACIRHGIEFRNHTSDDRISRAELNEIFTNVTNHMVIAVKGFYRRANLIPNVWKKKIGATHEKYVKSYDTNVVVQAFPGRMSGFWKDDITNGHKTGPHRTSITAVNEYIAFYKNPLSHDLHYQTASKKVFLKRENITNFEDEDEVEEILPSYRIYSDEITVNQVCTMLKYRYQSTKLNSEGFRETSLNRKREVVSLKDAVSKVPTAYGYNDGEKKWRVSIPCYLDVTDNTTLKIVVIIRPNDLNQLEALDTNHPSMSIESI